MGMQGFRVETMETCRVREGMQGIGLRIRGIRVGMQQMKDGNEGNQGENLRLRVEIMNKRCEEG